MQIGLLTNLAFLFGTELLFGLKVAMWRGITILGND